MSWVDMSENPSERQIRYSERLMEKCYGEIIKDIYSMDKSEISLVISKCKGIFESNKSLVI